MVLANEKCWFGYATCQERKTQLHVIMSFHFGGNLTQPKIKEDDDDEDNSFFFFQRRG